MSYISGSSGSLSVIKEEAPLSVHVVEDHNEALPHIYRAIARKKLPFSGTVLLHFDAHPDLLLPDIQAEDVGKKELLFSKASIADWILPAIYMGHLGRVVWVKPPWAEQISEGNHCLCVGRDRTSGHLRVSTPLPYFISELLCVDRDDLESSTSIPLDVITLHPSPDMQDPSPDTQDPSPDTQGPSPDTQGPSPDTQDPSPDMQGPSSDMQDSSPERQDQRKTPQIQTPSTEDKDFVKNPSTCEESVKNPSTCEESVKNPSTYEDFVKNPSTCEESVKNPSTCEESVKNPSTCEESVKNPSTCEESVKNPSIFTHRDEQEAVSLPPPKRLKLSRGGHTCGRENSLNLCLPSDLSAHVIDVIDSSTAWILDIDLDFFSTGNPFRSIYSEDQYKLLQRLYKLQVPQMDEVKPKAERVRDKECAEGRERQLSSLEQLWAGRQVSEENRMLFKLEPQEETLIREMKEMMGSIRNNSFIDGEYLHISGIMTDLPVHTSTQQEIAGLVTTMSSYLHRINKTPALITMSRSTEDDYTPPMQVESIQQQVLSALHHLYGNRDTTALSQLALEVHHHYTPSPKAM